MVGFVNISNTRVINSSGSFAFSIPRVDVNNFDALYTFKATHESAFISSLCLVARILRTRVGDDTRLQQHTLHSDLP